MSKTSPNSINSEFNQEKRKLLYWISQWSRDQGNIQTQDVDIPELSVLLQILGYKLESLEKISEVQDLAVASTSVGVQSTSRVQIACSTSGLNSTFINHAPACKCPTNEDVNNGQFWSVTGCVPSTSSQNSIYSSTSSLIPTISKGKLEIIAFLMTKIFEIMKDKECKKEPALELSQNALLTRHRSLDTLKHNEAVNIVNGSLIREKSWELDPKITPPTQTSSPVLDLTHSLSRISSDSQKVYSIVKNLEEMQKLVTESLSLAGTTSKRNYKRLSDIKPVNGAGVNEGMPNSSPQTSRIRGTPKRYPLPSGKPCGIPTPCKLPMLRTNPKALQKNSSKATSSSLKRSVLCKFAGQEVVFKSKLGAPSKTGTMNLPSSSKSNLPGPSGLGKFRNLANSKK